MTVDAVRMTTPPSDALVVSSHADVFFVLSLWVLALCDTEFLLLLDVRRRRLLMVVLSENFGDDKPPNTNYALRLLIGIAILRRRGVVG